MAHLTSGKAVVDTYAYWQAVHEETQGSAYRPLAERMDRTRLKELVDAFGESQVRLAMWRYCERGDSLNVPAFQRTVLADREGDEAADWTYLVPDDLVARASLYVREPESWLTLRQLQIRPELEAALNAYEDYSTLNNEAVLYVDDARKEVERLMHQMQVAA